MDPRLELFQPHWIGELHKLDLMKLFEIQVVVNLRFISLQSFEISFHPWRETHNEERRGSEFEGMEIAALEGRR